MSPPWTWKSDKCLEGIVPLSLMQNVIDGRQRFREERLKSSNAELRGSRFQDHFFLWGRDGGHLQAPALSIHGDFPSSHHLLVRRETPSPQLDLWDLGASKNVGK